MCEFRVKMVMNNERNLKLNTIERLIKFLKFLKFFLLK